MNREVVKVLDSLQYGRHLKVLYSISLVSRQSRKKFMQFLRNIPIGSLCYYVNRFMTSDFERADKRFGIRRKLDFCTAGYQMFNGLVYVFKFKTDGLLGDVSKLVENGFQQMYQIDITSDVARVPIKNRLELEEQLHEFFYNFAVEI